MDVLGKLVPPKLSGPPSSPVAGELYYDTGTNTLYWYNGSSWISSAGSGSPPDATSSSKGIIQLAGDLAGTAAAPQIAAGVLTKADHSTVLADRMIGDMLTHNEVTADLTVSATAQASGQTIVTSSSFTYDGATPVMIEWFAATVQVGASGQLIIDLWDDTAAATIGRFASLQNPAASAINIGALNGRRRLTPASGARVYSVRAWRVTANGVVAAGAGGPGVTLPGFIRITKA